MNFGGKQPNIQLNPQFMQQMIKTQGNQTSHIPQHSAPPNPTSFIFPKTFQLHQVFPTKQAIFLKMNKQAANNPNFEHILSMFLLALQPTKENCKFIVYRCRRCKVRLTFTKKHENFVLQRVKNQHSHPPNFLETQFQHDLFQFFRKNYTPGKSVQALGKQAQKLFRFSTSQFISVRNKYQSTQINTFEFLQSYLKGKCDYLFDWQDKLHIHKFPPVLLLISPTMRLNYLSHSPLITLHFIPYLLKNCIADGSNYKLGVFCCQDTNLRLLLAGLALVPYQSTANQIYKVLSMFFHLHKEKPKTIVTDLDENVVRAVEMMREQGLWEGGHMLDQRVLVGIGKEFRGGVKVRGSISRFIAKAKELINCRSESQYRRLLEELYSFKQLNQSVINKLVSLLPKLSYVQSQNTYSGIQRNSCRTLDTLISQQPWNNTTVYSFIKHLLKLDHKLHTTSKNSFQPYPQPLQRIFSDQKLKTLRIKTQRKIFQRFVENYVMSLGELVVVVRSQSRGKEWRVENKVTGEVSKVQGWLCGCGEHGRTGVPCGHLIAVVREEGRGMGYFEMIDARWRKDTPVSTQNYGQKRFKEYIKERDFDSN